MQVKPVVRYDLVNDAFESSGLNIGFRSKLDDESRRALPSFHQGRTIVRARVVSHKPAVKLR
jgi:hypothetical protein